MSLDFSKINVSNFIEVDRDVFGKGKNRVSILVIVILNNEKHIHHRIGREAIDTTIEEKVLYIEKRITCGKAIEDIKMLSQIKDSDIKEVMLIGNWTFIHN